MRQNMEQRPYKKRHFRLLDALVCIRAADIDVEITLDFKRGACTIHRGEVGHPDIRIVADADAILSLSLVNVRWGLPDFADRAGADLLKQILSGRIRIRGLLRHFVPLQLLTVVFSVN
jgi:hypothetical protein